MLQFALSVRTMLAYAAPALGCGYMYLLVSLFVMKYSTDVLLIAPAVMGAIFSASRIINAISDPIIGHISDRTQSRAGRRRFWMLASVLPTAVLFYMIFAQPTGLSAGVLTTWMAVAIIGYYVAINFCFIPHLSLGAELSNDNHQRNRLYGFRHAGYTLGSVLGLFTLQIFLTAEQQGLEALRSVVGITAIVAGLVFGALVGFAAVSLKERPDYAGTVQGSFFASLAHVWGNPHARLLLVVTLIENIGFAAVTVLALYITEYVVHQPLMSVPVILTYMLPSAVFAPLWARVAKRVGKVRLWMYSMLGTAAAFGGLFPILYFDGPHQLPGLMAMLFIAGLAAGCGGAIGPSVQSDVIDYDELHTGERKEGTYFAAWDFVFKSAYGLMLLLTGFILQAAGYVPNVEQAEPARLALVLLFSLFPMLCYVVGSWIFSKFQLDEKAHADILQRLRKPDASRPS